MDYIANHLRLCQNIYKDIIMPIAWNIIYKHQSLQYEETTDPIDVGCLKKKEMLCNLVVYGMWHLLVHLKGCFVLSIATFWEREPLSTTFKL